MTARSWLGRFIVWVVGLLLRRVALDPRWEAEVRAACVRGSPVFVLRHLSLVDFLSLDHLVRKAGLPGIGFVYGLDQWFFRPFRWLSRAWMRPPTGVTDERHLARLIRRGVPVCLFLRRRPRTFKLRPLRLGPRPLAICVGLARRGVPVTVVPEVLVWGRRPGAAEAGMVDGVLGRGEYPGLLRALVQAVLGRRTLLARQPPALDLAAWTAARRDRSAPRLGRVLDARLFRVMETELRGALGPRIRSHARTAAELFASARFQRDLRAVAMRRGAPPETVRVQAARMLREIAARFRIEHIEVFHVLMQRFVWTRVYEGIDVDPEGLARVKEAARRGPVILLPNHQSHIDYILLSQVFYDARLAMPFIAAGRNLSFWPLGPFFRGAGAFFIRRRFEGDALYLTVMRHYLRRLLLDGCHVEVFLEGTRSRTGKILPPRHGLLGLLAEAALSLPGRTVQVVPVAITHERVIEEEAHLREIRGEAKSAEDVGALLAVRRFLDSRNGRLHVRFAAPIDLRAYAAAQRIDFRTPEADPPRWRTAVRRLAYRAAYAVNRERPASPAALVATVLLDAGGRSLPRQTLDLQVLRLRDRLRSLDAPLARSLDPHPAQPRPDEAVRRVVERFSADGVITLSGGPDREVIAVDDRQRPRLDVARNTLLHFLLEPALVALGLSRRLDRAGLPDRVRRLARLWKYEFVFADEADALPGVERALRWMAAEGIIEAGPGPEVLPRQAEELRRLGRLLLPHLEAYAVALAVLERTEGPRRRADWIARCLDEAERALLRGTVRTAEARNRFLFAAALPALRDLGLVELPDPEHLRVPPDVRASDRLVEERLHLERLAAAVERRGRRPPASPAGAPG